MNGPRRTIFALSSAPGRAGVAVFRLSGPSAGAALAALAGPPPPPRRAGLRRLRDPRDGALIDRGLVLWLPAPASFTGEDMAELHVHGGRAVAAALAGALAALDDVRPAEAGEFARRAFASGRLDLSEAEGIADLIVAETEAQRRQAVRQMDGAASRLYEGWRERLMRACALVEAGLDFADEEGVDDGLDAAAGVVAELAAAIAAHLDDAHRGERLRAGVRVALAGPPNAGKSTLMNALARRDVAIVSERAGTTRDVIEVQLDLAGFPVTLSDMAGLRAAADALEAEGVRRARGALAAADVIVWLTPADAAAEDVAAPPGRRPGQMLVRVLSKCDLAGAAPPGDALALSAATGAGLDALVARLAALAGDLCAAGEAPAISRARHRQALADAHAALARFAAGHGTAAPAELLAEELRAAAAALGRITGRTGVEDMLDALFAGFCIGK